MGFILTEFNQETYEKCVREDGYNEGHENGLQQGLAEGAHQNAIETAKKLLADGKYTAEEISALLGIPVEEFAHPVPAQA